jgi:hypothetical protein
MKTITLLLLLAARISCFAVEDTNIIAAGEWSAPVAGFQDKGSGRGAHHPTLRGRLLLCLSPKNHSLAVYLELQEYSESWGNPTEVYCDLRPGGGCHLELRDGAGQILPRKAGGFNGGAPGAYWITLPTDCTARLRLSPYATFSFATTNDYFISGAFTADPPPDHTGLDVWQGTLKLPEMKVVVQRP